MPYLLTLGDSVLWGQGLRSQHKPGTLVVNALAEREHGLAEHLLAHAGAIIGIGTTVQRSTVAAEVPVSQPTVFEQLTGFPGDPRDVRIVLLNGGMNDVDVRNVLNPFVPLETLRSLIVEHCYDSMRQLLEATIARFGDGHTTIVVPGYYPILSGRSAPFRVPQMLDMHGINPAPALGNAAAFVDLVVERSLLFWRESTVALRNAVDEINVGKPAARVVFVDAGFREENAVFADDPWLWGLNPDLSPQDERAEERHDSCDVALPWFDQLAREQCYRASAGFPNRTGAERYATAIFAALTGSRSADRNQRTG